MIERASSSAIGCAATDTDLLLRRATALAGMGAWSCDLSNDRLTWTTGVYDLFGIPETMPLDRRETVMLYETESRILMERLRADAIARQGPFSLDAEIRRLDGERRWMRLTGDVVVRGGRVVQIYGLKQDITAERQRIEQLRQRADTDALTGLSSRRVFQETFLGGAVAAAQLGRIGALILFDADGFKTINDRHGHGAGDECLRVFATRLRDAFRDARMIARIGGDEFAVVSPDTLPPSRLLARLDRFLRDLSAPIVCQDRLLAISASAGLARPTHPIAYDAEQLYAAADVALYRAKRGGRNGVRVAKRDGSFADRAGASA